VHECGNGKSKICSLLLGKVPLPIMTSYVYMISHTEFISMISQNLIKFSTLEVFKHTISHTADYRTCHQYIQNGDRKYR